MLRKPPYTPAERAALVALYSAAPKADILATLIGRSWNALQLQANAMGLTRPLSKWSAADLVVLATDYPANGAKYVAANIGKDEEEVRRKAWNLHISRLPATAEQRAQRAALLLVTRRNRYLKNLAERPKQTVKLAPVVKPVVVKAAPLLSIKRSAKTPNLNLQKEADRRKREAAKVVVSITADAIRKLPANHPARHAYAMCGVLGWQQWNAKQAA